jgi:metal-sulfur cluster biosynthetic enzyme
MSVWTPEDVKEALKQIYDPEININIVDLGLIYNVEVQDNGDVIIDMTLTSPICPFGEVIKEETHRILSQMPGINQIHLNIVWEPPWDPKTMASEEAKLDLGLL